MAPKDDEERNKDVRDIIYNRMIKFWSAMFTYSGWRGVLEDGDKHDKYDEKFIYALQTKAKYLYHELSILLEKKEADASMSWKINVV